MTPTLPPIRFRAAVPADDLWVTGRLPGDRARGVTFVGERGGASVAAFAVAPPAERFEPEGLAVAFHVERTASDARAIAHQIVTLARAMAAQARLGPLHAWPSPIEASPADHAYRALGFAPFDRIVTWDVDAVHARQTLVPLLEPARAWSPDDPAWRAADAPLGEVDADAVVSLYEANLAVLGPTRPAFTARVRGGGERPFHPVRSRVLLLDGAPIAAMLIEFDPAVTRVAANIVAPAFRDGAASIRLIAAVNDAAPIPSGCRLRFETHDRHRATRGLARRLGAGVHETRVKLRSD